MQHARLQFAHRLLVAIASLLLLSVECVGEEHPVRFNQDIRPILSAKCFACHGPDAASRAADLRLDERDSALPVLSIRDVSKSELLRRIQSQDDADAMPPRETHKRVTPQEVAILKRWIEQGAPYEGHWAFIPPIAPQIPEVPAENVANPIDQFILSRLVKENLKPSPLADRTTLLRRASLDLTGLPPTPDEVQNFLNDPADDDIAYERVVDRLLASPRFGVHFASEWLDAARYGDSDGYERDPLRTMWPWRDWVVWALNENMPYDQFVVEQLAGDLLPNATMRQKLATGFNRNHRLNNEGGILPEEWLVEYVADRAETTATVFMGLTWGCARCHDHKFDPISQENYYELFAFFNNIPEEGSALGDRDAWPMMPVSQLDRLEKFEPIARQFSEVDRPYQERLKSPELEIHYQKWLTELNKDELQKLPKTLQQKTYKDWTDKQHATAREIYLQKHDTLGKELFARRAPVHKQFQEQLKTGAMVMIMEEMPEPRQTYLLERGAYDQPGKKVSAKSPDWLPPMDSTLPRNRLGLARWLVAAEHPLTARVTVNRFWARYFGTGLVKTADDFGSQGEPPSHPELLDWLALHFIQNGWDVKALQKQIVTSRTYRQSSAWTPDSVASDPENRLLARGPRFRLPATVIRDQALYFGGLLVEDIGGPPVKTYQPESLWPEIIKGSPKYIRDTGKNLYRYSLYTLWRRAVKPPQMTLLDASERDTCSVSQRRTNTPLQALLLMNDVTFVEAARGIAERMMQAAKTPEERICYGVLLVEGRSSGDKELAILKETFDAFLSHYQDHPVEAKRLITVGDSLSSDSLPVAELAAYTALARVLLNLDETITKQ